MNGKDGFSFNNADHPCVALLSQAVDDLLQQ